MGTAVGAGWGSKVASCWAFGGGRGSKAKLVCLHRPLQLIFGQTKVDMKRPNNHWADHQEEDIDAVCVGAESR